MPSTTMSPTMLDLKGPLKLNDDLSVVQTVLCHIRDAYTEVSLEDCDIDGSYLPRERRRGHRMQLQIPVIVSPVEWDDQDELVVCGEQQLAVTRDLSPTGVGLTHDQPQVSDLAILQVDVPGEGTHNLLMEFRWFVRTSAYSYMSGGPILGSVTAGVR